jgi:eukaryotic-like serine/threonine-protein kinase
MLITTVTTQHAERTATQNRAVADSPKPRYNQGMNVGSQIGQYRLLRKLGEGGMGLVFLGEHVLLGRRAAIKTLHPSGSLYPEVVHRFFNEARAASAISDPGVIQVFDFGYDADGTGYIVMELLEGESLAARVARRGKLPAPEALRIARQVASSLAVVHDGGVVHRDLKPENLFVVRDDQVAGGERTKVLDFGICKLSGEPDTVITQLGTAIGTPRYMSPEQCRGVGEIDHRADIYALGCVLFHMLTGRDPFEADAFGDLVVAHLREDPPAPSTYVTGLPFELDVIVLRCLAKAPEARYQTMDELQAAISAVIGTVEAATIEPVAASSAESMVAWPDRSSQISGQASEPVPPREGCALPAWTAIVLSLLTGALAGLVISALLLLDRQPPGSPLHDRANDSTLRDPPELATGRAANW